MAYPAREGPGISYRLRVGAQGARGGLVILVSRFVWRYLSATFVGLALDFVSETGASRYRQVIFPWRVPAR